MNYKGFSRLLGIMVKEFIEMRRDKATFGMILAIPLMQLILFGYAINTNPRHLPTAIVNPQPSEFTRRILVGMENSTYFQFISPSSSEEEAKRLIKRGEVQFVVNFPTDFSEQLVKGLKPGVLLEADATDPAATSRAVDVFTQMASLVLTEELKGPLESLADQGPPYEPIVHAIYNPLAITAYNIVPGLLGVVLTMTMVIVTALVITREYERGTMENLLATPLKPLEVMVGKLLPYIIVGYIQALLILIMARFMFHVPMEGSILLLLFLSLPFIAANLAMGLTFSTVATNQLQAVQSAMFFFLPSILLSGFMFPFRGMPIWAQWIGSALPLTHYLIIVRGILLKGNGFLDVWRETIPIIIFTLIVLLIGFKRYRQTLD
ncbi:ABC transporter permease [Legionella birminghamensis]|uniref:ABC transporter permease n=1 Tax=Legionella birminghamensis TaxID=28083 RepID=A0A378IDX0_9GAMM|nr:ABC transporter permease [Legionella birminghamensis]KTC66792.1 ABC transporter permease [Legionella birminghamensis]STX32942.1 ABC transporter permease [Legionella birminghamensis]